MPALLYLGYFVTFYLHLRLIPVCSVTEPLAPLSPLLTPTQRKCGPHSQCVGPAPAPIMEELGSARPDADVRPSLFLPWLGPSFQPTQDITFQTESSVAEQEAEFQSPKYIFHNFMERLWAYLTIQQLLEQM